MKNFKLLFVLMLSITLFSCGGDEEVNPVDPTQTEAEIYSDLIGVWEIEEIIFEGDTSKSEGEFCGKTFNDGKGLFKMTVYAEDGNLSYERIALCTGTSGYIGKIEINDNTIRFMSYDGNGEFRKGTFELSSNRLSITFHNRTPNPKLLYIKK